MRRPLARMLMCNTRLRWPEQPYQVYDENTCRVAFKRRLPSDDAWVVPHNLYVSMFNNSSVNVICFDPERHTNKL